MDQIRLGRRYLAIQNLHEEEGFSIVLLFEIAQISRAAYYKWLKRSPSERELENESLWDNILLLNEQVSGIYGYRRITMTINRYRKTVHLSPYNVKRIYRLMSIHGMKAIIRQKLFLIT